MDKKYTEAQLAGLKIPVFSLPWPGNISPDVSLVVERMIEWAENHSLFVNETYRERVKRTRYAWLAARCYPNTDRELLQVLANYFVWYFLVDDLFNSWLNICQVLRRLLSHEHFERFAQGMRLWATAAGLQILNHLQEKPAGVAQYETIRRHTSSMNPCLALSDIVNYVQKLCQHTNNIVCWTNDIQSLLVEAHQPRQFWNMVSTYASSGRTFQESIDCTAARVEMEINKFKKLSDAITQSACKELCGLIDGWEYWICGYMDWVAHDTQRYAQRFASTDADDRNVLG
ncbi:terpene synthase metal-binding domain-containing protein [Aspergillus alliaceus]|uniref:terpene synthase metal-binding domain-containing protein n=1 Tax=Petromyces alliaceus TaxID=209559 RepID=UPI0012A69050|nr:terpene synthase metal-binding domain-containing protein [Aspergillus alliaceus]KAB8226875.1 terpene synthase metal-binding domain-containing protein [Aspergillus alliaceus]